MVAFTFDWRESNAHPSISNRILLDVSCILQFAKTFIKPYFKAARPRLIIDGTLNLLNRATDFLTVSKASKVSIDYVGVVRQAARQHLAVEQSNLTRSHRLNNERMKLHSMPSVRRQCVAWIANKFLSRVLDETTVQDKRSRPSILCSIETARPKSMASMIAPNSFPNGDPTSCIVNFLTCVPQHVTETKPQNTVAVKVVSEHSQQGIEVHGVLHLWERIVAGPRKCKVRRPTGGLPLIKNLSDVFILTRIEHVGWNAHHIHLDSTPLR